MKILCLLRTFQAEEPEVKSLNAFGTDLGKSILLWFQKLTNQQLGFRRDFV